MNGDTDETKRQGVWGGAAIPPPTEIDGKLRELAAKLETAYGAAAAKGALVGQGIADAMREYRILPGQAPRPDMMLFADDAGMEKLLQQRLILHQVRAGVCMVLLQAAYGTLMSAPASKQFHDVYDAVLADPWVKLTQATWLEGLREGDRRVLAIEWACELTGMPNNVDATDTVKAGRRVLRNVYERAEREIRLRTSDFRVETLALFDRAKMATDASLATYAGEGGMRRLLEDRLRVIAETWAAAKACIQVAEQIAGKDKCARAVETIEAFLPHLQTDLRLQLAIEEGLGLPISDPSVQALLKGQLFLAAGAGPIWYRRHGESGTTAAR